jgi:hypothetical protein
MAKQSAIEQDGFNHWSIIKCDVPCRVREWTYCIAHISGNVCIISNYYLVISETRNEPTICQKQELLIDIKGYSKWKLELSKREVPSANCAKKGRLYVINKRILDLNKDKDNYGKNSRVDIPKK